jgi:hypothetical protein
MDPCAAQPPFDTPRWSPHRDAIRRRDNCRLDIASGIGPSVIGRRRIGTIGPHIQIGGIKQMQRTQAQSKNEPAFLIIRTSLVAARIRRTIDLWHEKIVGSAHRRIPTRWPKRRCRNRDGAIGDRLPVLSRQGPGYFHGVVGARGHGLAEGKNVCMDESMRTESHSTSCPESPCRRDARRIQILSSVVPATVNIINLFAPQNQCVR